MQKNVFMNYKIKLEGYLQYLRTDASLLGEVKTITKTGSKQHYFLSVTCSFKLKRSICRSKLGINKRYKQVFRYCCAKTKWKIDEKGKYYL